MTVRGEGRGQWARAHREAPQGARRPERAEHVDHHVGGTVREHADLAVGTDGDGGHVGGHDAGGVVHRRRLGDCPAARVEGQETTVGRAHGDDVEHRVGADGHGAAERGVDLERLARADGPDPGGPGAVACVEHAGSDDRRKPLAIRTTEPAVDVDDEMQVGGHEHAQRADPSRPTTAVVARVSCVR